MDWIGCTSKRKRKQTYIVVNVRRHVSPTDVSVGGERESGAVGSKSEWVRGSPATSTTNDGTGTSFINSFAVTQQHPESIIVEQALSLSRITLNLHTQPTTPQR